MRHLVLTFGLALSFPFTVVGQDIHHKHQDVDTVVHGSFNPNQATNLVELFSRGETSGVIRSMGMTTINQGTLSDHAALAVGGRLYFHTAYWKGIQMGLGGLYIYNLASTDLSVLDPAVNLGPRWERQLFDITDPHNKNDLDRLEELFIKYRYKDSYLKYGKMAVNTPLVNAQDSRMKPTVLNGLWFDWNEGHQFEINGGWFTKISPRSTTEWYSIGEAIGVYNTGFNPDGSPSEYEGNISTNGMLIIGGHVRSSGKNFIVHLWQYQLMNVFRTTFYQMDYKIKNTDFGLQYINQSKLNNGGNENYAERYFHSTIPSHLISGKWEYDLNHIKFSINGTYSLSDSPFIFPREFGTANLFTFISRHRVEGLSGFNTHTAKLNYFPLRDRSLDLGIYYAHTKTDLQPALNKYNTPTFDQFNLDLKYHFHNSLDGLDLRLITVLMHSGDEVSNPEHLFYKTNLLHINLVGGYKF